MKGNRQTGEKKEGEGFPVRKPKERKMRSRRKDERRRKNGKVMH